MAKAKAFDSIIALSQARALSDDANADESRYLVDPAGPGSTSRRLRTSRSSSCSWPGPDLPVRRALARAISAYRANHADIGFGGYFGAEFRNITFAGERAAAEQTLAAYQVYERDDRHIRR